MLSGLQREVNGNACIRMSSIVSIFQWSSTSKAWLISFAKRFFYIWINLVQLIVSFSKDLIPNITTQSRRHLNIGHTRGWRQCTCTRLNTMYIESNVKPYNKCAFFDISHNILCKCSICDGRQSFLDRDDVHFLCGLIVKAAVHTLTHCWKRYPVECRETWFAILIKRHELVHLASHNDAETRHTYQKVDMIILFGGSAELKNGLGRWYRKLLWSVRLERQHTYYSVFFLAIKKSMIFEGLVLAAH